MRRRIVSILCITLVILSCGTTQKAKKLEKQNLQVTLTLAEERGFTADTTTFAVRDKAEGGVFFMKAVKDENGDMVASEKLDAAIVTARFRNVAERHGQIDIGFQVIVPQNMQDSKWQLRFYPDMFALEDSVRLESVIITGEKYRRDQMRGYERYNSWLRGIVEDSTKFINVGQLEIFLKRNFPDFYRMKEDSTDVSDERFRSIYGVTEKEAIEHYTNKIARAINEHRKASKSRKFNRFVKVPIVTEGLRLDTVIRSSNGEFVYNYVQTVNTRPNLKKVDVKIGGEIFEADKKVYTIPRSEPLTFYISSLSTFVDETERRVAKIEGKDTSVVDTTYMAGVQAIKDRDYKTAITLLTPYGDYNLAVAYVAMDMNASALKILEGFLEESRTAQVNYLLAILYSRRGEDKKAIRCYLESCKQNPSYVHRGNLDPEISALTKKYNVSATVDFP